MRRSLATWLGAGALAGCVAVVWLAMPRQPAPTAETHPLPTDVGETGNIKPSQPIAESPAGLTIRLTGQDLVMVGSSLPDPVRATLRDEAQALFPGKAVRDEPAANSGSDKAVAEEPARVDALAAARLALSLLSETLEGHATIVDGTLSLSGSARTPESVEAVRVRTALLPAGLRLGSVAVEPRGITPYAFKVVRDAEGLRLSGFYQDRAMQEQIRGLVRDRFPAEPVTDEMGYGIGAPEGYLAGVQAALDRLSRLARGQVSLSDKILLLEGESLYAQAGARIEQAAARGLPDGWTGSAAVRTRGSGGPESAQACRAAASDHLNHDPIRFDADSASIRPESNAALLAAASVLAQCAGTPLTIVARPESGREGEAHAALARRRAEAVAERLAASGVDRARVKVEVVAKAADPESGRIVEIVAKP